MTWRTSYSYLLIAAICFAVASVSMLIPGMGSPMLFAFTALFIVFLLFGAIEYKKEDLKAAATLNEGLGRRWRRRR